MLKILFFFAFFCFPLHASDTKNDEPVFNEGEHYKVLEGDLKKNSILTIYSVYCSACYSYETMALEYIKQGIPKDVKWEEVHISSSGRFSDSPSKILEAMPSDKKAAVKMAMYRIIHDGDVRLISDFYDALKDEIPLSLEEIKKITSDEKIGRKVEEQEAIGAKYARMVGIPAIIVNNRYIVVLKNLKNVGQMKDLISFLLNKDNK